MPIIPKRARAGNKAKNLATTGTDPGLLNRNRRYDTSFTSYGSKARAISQGCYGLRLEIDLGEVNP